MRSVLRWISPTSDCDRKDHAEGMYDARNTKVKDKSTHAHGDQDVTGEGKNFVMTMHCGDGDTQAWL